MLYRALALVALTLAACEEQSPFPETVYIDGGPQVIDFPIGGDECWQQATTRPVAHLLAPPKGMTFLACFEEDGEWCYPQTDWWVKSEESGGYGVYWMCGQTHIWEWMEDDGHVLISYW